MRDSLQQLCFFCFDVARRHPVRRSFWQGVAVALVIAVGHAEAAFAGPISLQVDPSRSYITLLPNEFYYYEMSPLFDGGLTTYVSGSIDAILLPQDDILMLGVLQTYWAPDKLELAKREVPGYPEPAQFFASTPFGGTTFNVDFNMQYWETFDIYYTSLEANSTRVVPNVILDWFLDGSSVYGEASDVVSALVTYSALGNEIEVVFSFQTQRSSLTDPFNLDAYIVATAIVPEPSTISLAVAGLLALLGWRRICRLVRI